MTDTQRTGWYAHPTAVIDEGAEMGAGTKVWHFSHVLAGCAREYREDDGVLARLGGPPAPGDAEPAR